MRAIVDSFNEPNEQQADLIKAVLRGHQSPADYEAAAAAAEPTFCPHCAREHVPSISCSDAAIAITRAALAKAEKFPAWCAPGALVQLRSGGPVMTVENMGRHDGLICTTWFSGTELRRDAFEQTALQQVTSQQAQALAEAIAKAKQDQVLGIGGTMIPRGADGHPDWDAWEQQKRGIGGTSHQEAWAARQQLKSELGEKGQK